MSSVDENGSEARERNARAARIRSAPAQDAPRRVTRGETPAHEEGSPASAAIVDWLAFSVRPPCGRGGEWLEAAISTVFCIPREGWSSKGRGWFGYAHRLDLGTFGLLAHGGKAQKGTLHVELNAHACARVTDWNAVRLWGEVYAASITRVDLAHDDFVGSVVNIPTALQWLREGAFNSNGRPPRAELIDDLGSGAGRTLYVGGRGSGKLLRIYEKGRQLGEPRSAWVRAEVELRNKGRVVPWEAVVSPGRFLAGAHPALGVLSAEQSRIRTVRRSAEIIYAAMVKNLRTQGGKALNVMCAVNEGDTASVLSQVVREGVPKRLVGLSDAVREVVGGQR